MAVIRDQGIAIHGFAEFQKALDRISSKSDFGLEYELQRRLRVIGEKVAATAAQNVTHKTGRHGDPGLPRLEDTLKVSVTKQKASVGTNSPYAAVQNFGGGPKFGWTNRGPHVQRKNASKWLTKSVAEEREFVNAEIEGLLDWLAREFDAA